MRNLKRALSLALASVMVASMTLIGAGAVSIDDFSDAEEIVNKEAVTTMVSLGVIDGNDDGSYNPTGVVKRGEMAKLIAVMLNGGKEPTLGAMTATFSDTVGHWAQSYITYVANLHIIDGRGDGTFGPNDDVTGSEAAKMILTALGYRSDVEGFTGANWAINVQLKANDIKLFDGLSINPDEGLTRDNTAQMLYNAVQAQEVEYRNLDGNYDNVIYPSDKGTVLENRFNVRKVEGVVQATSLLSLDNTGTTVSGKTRLTEILYNGEEWGEYKTDSTGARVWVWDEITYPVEMDVDLLGQRVVIYVRGLNDLSPNASGMEVIGTVITSDDNTVVTTSGRLKDADAVKDALRDAGLTMPSGGANGVQVTEEDTAWAKDTGIENVPGVEQTFIDNDADGRVDVVVQKTPALALVNTYNESGEKLNLSGIGSIDFDDIQNPEDVAVDDHVLVYNYEGTYVLAVAESVTGTVTAFNNNSSANHMSSVTVDDTKYVKGAGENLATDLLDLDYGIMQEMVDGSYTLYLDPHGYVLGYVEDDSAAGNYAVITGVNSTGHTNGFYAVEVKLIMADGTTGKYDVNLASSYKKWTGNNTGSTSAKELAMYEALTGDTNHNGSIDAGETSKVDTLVTYSLDGNTVTLGLAGAESSSRYDTTETPNALELTNTVSRYTFNDGSLMTDDKTVFFIKDSEGNYTAVQGLANLRAKEMTTVGTSQAIYYTPAGTSVLEGRAIFSEVDEEYTSNSNYAFVTGNYTKTNVGTETIYTYPVVFENGEVGTLAAKDDAGVGSDKVHEYQLDGDYVNFDVNTTLVVNTKIVTSVGTNAVSFADAKNPNQGIVSYPSRGAQVWNVEDSDNVFSTTLKKNDLVGLVLDDDGNIVTAFVYDRQDDDMTSVLTGTGLTMTGETPIDVNGGSFEWTGVANGDVAALNLQLGSTQKANVKVEATNVKGTAYTTAAAGVDYAVGAVITQNIYAATTAAEAGGKITVTVTVEDTDDKLLDRVIVYELTLKGDVAPAPTSVTLASGTTNGITTITLNSNALGAGNQTLEAGGEDAATATPWATGTTDSIKLTVALPSGATAVYTLTNNGNAVAGWDSGDDITLVEGENKLVLTVKTSKDNCDDTTTTYKLNINASKAALTGIPTVVAQRDGSTVSGTTVGDTTTYDIVNLLPGKKVTLNPGDVTTADMTATVKSVDVSGKGTLAGTVEVSAGALTSNTANDIYTAAANESGTSGTIEVTVEFAGTGSKSGTAPETRVYVFNISCPTSPAPVPTTFAVDTSIGTGTYAPGAIDTDGTGTIGNQDSAVGDKIFLSITPAAGTQVSISVDSAKATWDDAEKSLTLNDVSADITVTVTVTGTGYSTRTFTFNVDAVA